MINICVQLTYEYAIVHKLGYLNSLRSLRWQKGPHSAGFLVHDWKQLAHFLRECDMEMGY